MKTKTAVLAGVVLLLAFGTTVVRDRMDDPFQQESITRVEQAKKWALACMLFADAHGKELPKDFSRVKPFESNDGLSDSNWEIVSSGDANRITNPAQTILLREKEARKSPRGDFIKIYAFADGHVDRLWSPEDNCTALEKKRGLFGSNGQ
ncbi:MAG: hypothetical protein ACLQVY_18440 [Limisphaerales bacterium]